MIKKQLSLAVLTAFFISSCSMASIEATRSAINQDKKKGNSLYDQTYNPINRHLISYSKQPFLASKSFVVSNVIKPLPKVFNKNININNTTQKPLAEYINNLVSLTGLNIQITNNALDDLNKQVISYTGSLKGYLDRLTNSFGLSWEYNHSSKDITIFVTETKTFKLIIPESQIDNSTSISNSDANNKSSVSYKTKTTDAFQEAVDTIKSFSKNIFF